MLKDPSLAARALGVRQKQIVVTCNYPARARCLGARNTVVLCRGVGKCMAVREALALCPELVLVCGEDLAEYRRVGGY